MIILIKDKLLDKPDDKQKTIDYLSSLKDVKCTFQNLNQFKEGVTEVYITGDTSHLSKEDLEALPGVSQVIVVQESYPHIGKQAQNDHEPSFSYKGIEFSQEGFELFAGLNAVDNAKNVESTFKILNKHGLTCSRMGAYKPRTSPYSFQGHGEACLPYVFELASTYGIKVIAMEVTHERHVDEIQNAISKTKSDTGVLLQIGTRNAQNFELLKAVGRQREFPVLFKRGFGITLAESLHATEYLVQEGNNRVIFALRGVKSYLGDPHRNIVDFAHVPIIKRLSHMPVCIDPSHSVGTRARSDGDGIMDIFHITAQGIIAGANMALVDFHPNPKDALVDAKQALHLNELEWYLEDIKIARDAYLKRKALAEQFK